MLSVLNGRETGAESCTKREPVETDRRVPHVDPGVLLVDFEDLITRKVFDLDLHLALVNLAVAFSSTDFLLCLAHS